jgi:hypothetical protein
MNKWAIGGAWVLVAVLATGLTWQIVSAADAQVGERPPLQVAPAPSTSEPTSSLPSTTSSTTPGASSSITTPDTGASLGSGASTTVGPPATQAAWSSRTIPTGGGVVVVSYRPGEVILSSASPAAGFAAEIKKSGPPEVDVEFESESAKYRVEAEWAGGDLSVEVESD